MFPTFHPNTLYFRICKKKSVQLWFYEWNALSFLIFFFFATKRATAGVAFSLLIYVHVRVAAAAALSTAGIYILFVPGGGQHQRAIRDLCGYGFIQLYMCVCGWTAIMFPLCAYINIWSAREMDNTMGNTHTYTYIHAILYTK